MARPCSVCAHMERAEIDRRLALQVVNMSEIARTFGLKKDAVRGHRAQHLPQFLPAFQARADALTLDVIAAEAQRLYLVTLDALAAAEHGVLVEVGEDGREHRKVSSTAVARLIREARTGLGMLASLAADGATTTEPDHANAALDERIAAALDRAARRDALPAGVLDVEEVDEDDHLDHVNQIGGVGAARGARETPGPGAADAPGPRASSKESQILPTPPVDLDPAHEDSPRRESGEDIRLRLIEHARSTGHPVSVAATLEELHEMGLDTTALPPE